MPRGDKRSFREKTLAKRKEIEEKIAKKLGFGGNKKEGKADFSLSKTPPLIVDNTISQADNAGQSQLNNPENLSEPTPNQNQPSSTKPTVQNKDTPGENVTDVNINPKPAKTTQGTKTTPDVETEVADPNNKQGKDKSNKPKIKAGKNEDKPSSSEQNTGQPVNKDNTPAPNKKRPKQSKNTNPSQDQEGKEINAADMTAENIIWLSDLEENQQKTNVNEKTNGAKEDNTKKARKKNIKGSQTKGKKEDESKKKGKQNEEQGQKPITAYYTNAGKGDGDPQVTNNNKDQRGKKKHWCEL